MDKLSRNGHRQRIRSAYIANGIEGMHDHNVLELLLSLVIPQKDVKPLAYDLINTFGSLQGVMSASVDDLMQVKGIGECAAVAISLVSDINSRLSRRKNDGIKSINSASQSVSFFENILSSKTVEQLSFVSLDNANCIIASHTLPQGTVNSTDVSIRKISEYLLRDNASCVIVGHNHPMGDPEPSSADLSFTLELRDFLNVMNIELVDHIIIGNTPYSMRNDSKYCQYFSSEENHRQVATSKSTYNLKLYLDELNRYDNDDDKE